MKAILTAFDGKLKSEPMAIRVLTEPDDLLLPFDSSPPLVAYDKFDPPEISGLVKYGRFRYTGRRIRIEGERIPYPEYALKEIT